MAEAIAELNETVALDPKHPQPHLLLSQIYFRMGDEAKAKAEKEISLRLRREIQPSWRRCRGGHFRPRWQPIRRPCKLSPAGRLN